MAEGVFESGWQERYPGSDTSMIAGLPMPAIETTHSIITNRMDKKESYRTIVGELGGDERMDLIQTASGFLAYRADKTIINIDQKLYESLESTPFPDKFLVSNIVLPSRAVVLSLEGEKKSIVAFFDMNAPETGDPSLIFKLSEFDHVSERFSLRLAFIVKQDETLVQAIDAHIKMRLVRQKEIEDIRSEAAGYLSLIGEKNIEANMLSEYSKSVMRSMKQINGYLNCLLYAMGNDDIVSTIGNRKTSKDPLKAKRFRDLAPQSHSVLGSKYGKVVQRFLDDVGSKSHISGEGKSKRPHIRSGHAHLYWKKHPTIKGKKIQIVHYLPPTVVGKDWDKEADDPTNTKLK